VTLQIVASLIDAARGIIYDRHMFIVQTTILTYTGKNTLAYFEKKVYTKWKPGAVFTTQSQ